MKKKYHIYIFDKTAALLFIILITGVSCKKLIQIPPNPPSEIAQAQVFADSSDATSALAGVYNNLKVSSYNSMYGGSMTFCTGLTSDELTVNPSSFYITNPQSALQLYANQIVDNNYYTPLLWSGAYSLLYQINVCLEQLNSSSALSQSQKQDFIGELDVVRAQLYFHLINLYGAVPLVTSSNYHINATLPRTSVDSVYKQIITDLTNAQQLLTPTYPSVGHARPNLYTADALLAKVYLYQGEWAQAADMASKIINSGLYSLESDLTKVFLDGSKEAIWQLPTNGISFQVGEGYVFVPYASVVIPTYPLSSYLLNAFEQGDKRKTTWIGANVSGGSTYYYAYKYKNRTPTALPAEDYMFYRLGEQYLIRAEALAHEGKIDSALADFNLIRNRAGLPNSKATQSNILDSIMHERQVELFCELGNRWFDLKRTGTINTVLGKEKTGWQATDSLYPIPLIERQSNPALTQNPGY